jgi:hypothetical protein
MNDGISMGSPPPIPFREIIWMSRIIYSCERTEQSYLSRSSNPRFGYIIDIETLVLVLFRLGFFLILRREIIMEYLIMPLLFYFKKSEFMASDVVTLFMDVIS